MKKTTIIKIIVFSVIGFVFALYIAVSCYLSVKTSNMLEASKQSSGVLADKYKNVISKEDFKNIYWVNRYEDLGECDVNYSHTMPFTYFTGLTSAVTYYEYTGKIRCKTQEFFAGSANVSCKFYWEFSNGQWVVSDYWEHV